MGFLKKKPKEEVETPKPETTEVQQMDLTPETPITIKDESGKEIFLLKTTTDKLLFEMLMVLKQMQETNK
jgi:hypothetical protein